MPDEKERRRARIDALTDRQRHVVLSYLAGLMPEAVDTALDDLGIDRHAAEVGKGAISIDSIRNKDLRFAFDDEEAGDGK